MNSKRILRANQMFKYILFGTFTPKIDGNEFQRQNKHRKKTRANPNSATVGKRAVKCIGR